VKDKQYRIILMSPEICLGNSRFAALLKKPRWSCSILFMVVDEAHCIKQWGSEFQKQYTSLETLHSFHWGQGHLETGGNISGTW